MPSKAELIQLIEGYQELIAQYQNQLDNYVEEEEKEPQLSWYTVCYVNGLLHIDQWLDATDGPTAKTLAMACYGLTGFDILYLQAPIGEVKVEQQSYPF